jgi:hypothetical protein
LEAGFTFLLSQDVAQQVAEQVDVARQLVLTLVLGEPPAAR